MNLRAWTQDAFCLCDSHPGELPGGGNGIPTVHDGELTNSDTGRVFREDGDGSARTRIWTHRVDCCHFDAFRLCDSHPGESPGGGNGIPMGHGGELKDSDTGRAFREDGDGSARTRIWTYRVDCYCFFTGLPASYDIDMGPYRDCDSGRRSIRHGGTVFPLTPLVQGG